MPDIRKVRVMNAQKNMNLPLKIKFGYGAAEGANSMVFTLFYTFGMFFFTDVVGLSPAFAGIILVIGTLWDAITDPLVGIWSDSVKSKWGRRRPFLLGIAVPYGLVTWLLFTDFDLSPSMTKAYFLVMVILYFAAFTLLNIPYTALAAEMTQDYNDRTSLNGWRAGWSQVASIVGAGTPLALANYFTKIGGSKRFGWSCMSLIFGLICIPLIFFTWRMTRGRELFPEVTTVHINDVWNAAFKNRPFRFIVGLYAFALIGMTAAGSVGVYFMTYFMGFSEDQISVAFLILFGFTVAWIPLIDIVSERLGKRMAWLIFVGMWACVQIIGIQLLMKPERNLLLYILMAFAAGGLVGSYQLGWAMIPDCVEVDEFKTGHRREGLYYGITTFTQKTGCAIALWIVGALLTWVGYVPGVQQSEKALMGIKAIYGIGVALCLIISILFAFMLPMTKDKHDALRKAIALKKEGKEFDTLSIEDIIR